MTVFPNSSKSQQCDPEDIHVHINPRALPQAQTHQNLPSPPLAPIFDNPQASPQMPTSPLPLPTTTPVKRSRGNSNIDTPSCSQGTAQISARKGKKVKKDPVNIATTTDRYPQWWLKSFAPQLHLCVTSAKARLRCLSILASVNPYGPGTAGRKTSAEAAYNNAQDAGLFSIEEGK
jgi:hypothetical protein